MNLSDLTALGHLPYKGEAFGCHMQGGGFLFAGFALKRLPFVAELSAKLTEGFPHQKNPARFHAPGRKPTYMNYLPTTALMRRTPAEEDSSF